MIVKICGIQTIEHAKVASNAGADFIGFVFAKSKRQITPSKAATIANAIPTHVKKVGVFVNESVVNMCHIAQYVGLDVIQLHGNEGAEIAKEIPYPIIKAFPIDEIDCSTIHSFPCDYYLIDSPAEQYRGGSGKTFNWDLLRSLNIDRNKLILAGGLTPENVTLALEQLNPVGVDVSSGVETDGKKDNNKIRQFLANARKLG